ncbi:transcription elongation factor [Striga asiatica]|uniref:Transcription elongation factor n=1 Tax=Striga asiatica TaxID=4170 RepID=A0A5A7QM07_STRAF|nr:transcription elongation factor [Striga asiatica]
MFREEKEKKKGGTGVKSWIELEEKKNESETSESGDGKDDVDGDKSVDKGDRISDSGDDVDGDKSVDSGGLMLWVMSPTRSMRRSSHLSRYTPIETPNIVGHIPFSSASAAISLGLTSGAASCVPDNNSKVLDSGGTTSLGFVA